MDFGKGFKQIHWESLKLIKKQLIGNHRISEPSILTLCLKWNSHDTHLFYKSSRIFFSNAFRMKAFSSKLISIGLNSSWTCCTFRSIFSKIIRPQSPLKPKEFASRVAAYKQRVLKLSFLIYIFNYHQNLQIDLSLKSNSHLPKNLCYLFHWKPFKNDETCFLFHLKSSFHSQDI